MKVLSVVLVGQNKIVRQGTVFSYMRNGSRQARKRGDEHHRKQSLLSPAARQNSVQAVLYSATYGPEGFDCVCLRNSPSNVRVMATGAGTRAELEYLLVITTFLEHKLRFDWTKGIQAIFVVCFVR